MKETVTLKVERQQATLTQRFSRAAMAGGQTRRRKRPRFKFDDAGHAVLDQLFEDMYDGVIVTDLDGQIIYSNQRACEHLGVGWEFLVSCKIIHVISGSDENLVDAVVEAINSQAYARLEAGCRRADGSVFPAEITVNALWITDDGLLCFFIRNLSKRKAQEATLMAAERRCATILAGVCDWYWETDADGRFVFCSEQVRDSLGCEPTDLVGTSMFELVSGDLRAEKIDVFRQLAATGAALDNMILEVTPESGEPKRVALSGMPVLNADGTTRGYQGVAIIKP